MQRHTVVNFIKIVTANEARIINRYKNLKHKILKYKAHIHIYIYIYIY